MALFGTVSPDKPLTNRNLIINGAMQIAQRNTSITGITTEAYRTADRWLLDVSSAGTWTMNVESSGPTGTEFRNSANLICTTADTSLSGSDRVEFQQRLEGQNLQGIKKGTVNAESLTVSFWVKSSNTGTYIFELSDSDNSRQISKSYTINTANTWEKKTITFPPDTTGQFNNDNGNSLVLFFWLAAGPNFTSGTLNSSAWASDTTANRVVGQLNLANAVGNYFAFTGVQMEIGTVATPYEWRNYGEELHLCQRYYEILSVGAAMVIPVGLGQNFQNRKGIGPFCFKVEKRTSPTIPNRTIGIDGGDGTHAFTFSSTTSMCTGASSSSSPTISAADLTEGAFTILADSEL
jgi:hypothetical protein